MNVVWFLLRRLGWMILTLWIIYTVSFVLVRIVPGGPFSSERNHPPDIEQNLQARYHLDQPLYRQYMLDLSRILSTGDLGVSTTLKDYSVNEVIAEGFPISASLGILALIFAMVLGVLAGVMGALRRQGVVDVALMSAATLGVAVPNFVLAGLAIIVFVFVLHWFPAAGWGTLRSVALPALCLGAPYAAYIARLTRTSMLEVLGQDYIRTAYAKGLSRRSVVTRHAMQGAMLPVVSYLGPAVAGVLTGSLVLERMFFLPGMGTHFIQAAMQSDYTMAMGMVLVYTLLLFVMNTLVDLSYAVIDPRVKIG
ncbi:MAG: ABC transporter permease subunit [Planctomycetales bacterium]|nr:ABC transporter permease subunit [Planctomycetales bacterium]